MEDQLLEKHNHRRLKLAVSGAAETGHCGEGAMDLAKELGREIIRQDGILISGATTGFPLWTCIGAKEAGGISIGLSPAYSEHEHVDYYKLPLEYLDLIIYTGFGYSGRDLLMTRTSDAIFLGCGRVGTIHEFTIAFEDQKPIGVLEGPWKTHEVIKDIMDKGYRHSDLVLFDKDPKKLVERVIELVKKTKIK
ncbi:MAG: LOG family protein [Candidatus Vogelbacteria bacterium]|nr:LOG family protein [Candidatus Vogelbacteria bacterium]